VNFAWDPRKERANRLKHGVALDEARSVFFDPLARIQDDDAHSSDERRYIIVGLSNKNRLLLVAFVDRGSTIRIVSARQATRRERRNMKKRTTKGNDDLKPEYDFDYSKSRPNHYAARLRGSSVHRTNDVVMVSLEPDVAKAFPTAKAVNGALRSVMKRAKRPAVQTTRSKGTLRSSAA
jgi:uncharacterized protein